MSRKSEKTKTTLKPKQRFCTFPTSEEDIARWKAAAKSVDRSLSWWIRNTLNNSVPAGSIEEKQEVAL